MDDHEIIRKGLRCVLETREDWEIVGEAATGREAVKKVEELKPDVVVMDISMPELNGLEAIIMYKLELHSVSKLVRYAVLNHIIEA